MRLLVCNAGNYANKGDVAILVAMLEQLLKRYPDASIDVTGGGIKSFYDAKLVEPVFRHPQIRFVELPGFLLLGALKRMIKGTINKKVRDPGDAIKPIKKFNPPPRYKRVLRSYLTLVDCWLSSGIGKIFYHRFLEELYQEKEVDFSLYRAVIATGGTQLEDREYDGYPGFAGNLTPFAGAVSAGIPYVITGQSIGPIKSWFGRFVVRSILNHSQGIGVREEESARYLQENFKLHCTVNVCSDWAYLLKPASKDRVQELLQGVFSEDGGHKLIIIPRIIDVTQRGSKGDAFLSHFSDVLRYFAENGNVQTALLAQTIDEKSLLHDDLQTCKRIKGLAGTSTPVLDTRTWSVGELAAVLSSADLLLTARMHSIILGASTGGVPVIALSHLHKFQGTMQQLGLRDLVLDDSAVTSEIIIDMVRNTLLWLSSWQDRVRFGASSIQTAAFRNMLLVDKALKHTVQLNIHNSTPDNE